MPRRKNNRKRGGRRRPQTQLGGNVIEYHHGSIASGAIANFPRSSFNSIPAGRGFRLTALHVQFVGYSAVSTTAWSLAPAMLRVNINSPLGVEVANSGTILSGSLPRRATVIAPRSTDWYSGDTVATTVLVSLSNLCYQTSVSPSLAYTVRAHFSLAQEDEPPACPTFQSFGFNAAAVEPVRWFTSMTGTVGESNVTLDGVIGGDAASCGTPFTSVDDLSTH
jgi:hypothetical protein